MKHLNYPLAGLLLALGLTGCVDDNYKINDANTLTRINIKDLTVPLNVEKVCLDSIVDLTEGTNVEIYTDPTTGREYYALVEEGEIDSDPIEINPITTKGAEIETSTSLLFKDANGAGISYPLEAMGSDFLYTANDVDASVKTIEEIVAANHIRISLVLTLPSSFAATRTSVENVQFQFPKGLSNLDGTTPKANVGTYDPKTGLLTVPAYDFPDAHRGEFFVVCDEILFPEGSAQITAERRFEYRGEMGTKKEGKLSIQAASASDAPATLTLTAEYDLAAFDVRYFSGEIDYEVENTAIDPIHLDDLPDFLQDPETKIIISDPQFYLTVNNPTAPYGTEGSAHLKMASDFRHIPSYSSESPVFVIPDKLSTNLCLSSSGDVKNPLTEFAKDLEQYEYPGMSYMLSGKESDKADGLPYEINVEFANPRLFGHAHRFPVKNDYHKEEVGKMHGSYKFFTPLAFGPGSVIVYSESTDIGGDETKDIYIDYLTVKAAGESSFPVDVTLSATAYDVLGKKLGSSNSLRLPALSVAPVELTIKSDSGEPMNGVYTIDFHAYIIQEETGAGEALAPDQGLELNNLKITVSGYYEKEF